MLKSLAVAALAFATTGAIAVEPANDAKIRAAILEIVPKAKIDSIADAAIPGFYEVVLGGEIVYVSADAKYLFTGSVWDLAAKKDLTDSRKSTLRKVALDKVGDDKRITYAAKSPKHTVTVYTDIDCGYCRRLHQQMTQYNDAGITVEYLFFPRSGPNTESFQKAVHVWCAADRNDALTKAKNGEAVPAKECANPIAEAYDLGLKIGVTGTPMIVAEDGTQVGGYLDPTQLVARLESLKATGK
ncbi:MAG TPA: DsbC family protein [Candidatus Saccharimonadia bacterium]|nr:DsbC family protein [Candidatus Saccharimonadia bacterium]